MCYLHYYRLARYGRKEPASIDTEDKTAMIEDIKS